MELTTDNSDSEQPRLPLRPDAEQASSTLPTLTAYQLHALFDILTHYQTYQEIQEFKDPDTIYSYGTPFAEKAVDSGSGSESRVTYADHSGSPILHMLFNKTVLSLPPAKTLPQEFWHVRIQRMVSQLGEAELSESYDQGALGTRKILATASSSLIESLGRGALGGYPGGHGSDGSSGRVRADGKPALADRTYDTSDADDFAEAWDDVLRAMIYGDLVDELFTYCAEHDNIEHHSAAVKAAVDYIIIHLAEFLHYVFVLSPNGRYLTKLVENVHQLVPYTVVRQTLRVGNAATMINGMMKLLLAKLSVGGLTNWMGLTTSADDGMNLLQRIISLVLSYDSYNFKKAAEKIEKTRDGPSKAHLAAIKEHMARPRQYHEAVRRESMETERSMVVCILDSVDPSLTVSLTDSQHALCAQYYAALLSIHDRREITNVFCRQNPDLFTQALRDVVAACDPIIRGIHDRIDLKEHVTDIEGFINEFIEISKGSKAPASPAQAKKGSAGDERVLPTVKDYAELFRRNSHLLYKWLHRVAKDTPEIRDTFRGWAVETIKVFRGPKDGASKDGQHRKDKDRKDKKEPAGSSRLADGAGAFDKDLTAIFASLPADTRSEVVSLLDDHVTYLAALDEAATKERQALLDKIYGSATSNDRSSTTGDNGDSVGGVGSPTKRTPGSGRFISRWQELLDDTLIGPATADGPLRRGRDIANVTAQGKTGVNNGAGPTGTGTGIGSFGAVSGSKLLSRKTEGFMSGFASPRSSSRQPSPERSAASVPAMPVGRINVGPQPPNVLPVVDAMGKQFRQILVERW